MLNIMKADFYRLKKSKILLGIMAGWLIFFLLGNYNAATTKDNGLLIMIADLGNHNIVSFYPNGSAIMPQLLHSTNFLIFFLVPIVLFVFISDFKWGTVKNIIPFKYSRGQIFLAKYVVCLLISLLLPILYSGLGLLVNQVFHGFSGVFHLSDFVAVFKIIGLQIPLYMGFVGIILLLGLLTGSNTIVASVTIAYQFFICLFWGLFTNKTFIHFEPVNCIDWATHLSKLSQSAVTSIVSSGAVLTVVSLILGYQIFRKKSIR